MKKTENYKYFSINTCRIVLIVTILTISGMTFNSCTNARSVRNIKTTTLSDKQEKAPKAQKISKNKSEPAPVLAENEPIEETSAPIIPETVVRQIPTLREQMAIIADDQKAANKRLDNIEREIGAIKEIVKNINFDISDLKSDLDIAPIAGKNINTQAPQSNEQNRRTILLPDDKAPAKANTNKNDKIIEKAINETYFEKDAPKSRATNQIAPDAKPKSPEQPAPEPVKVTESTEFANAKNLYDKASYAQALSQFQAALHKETSKSKENEINFYIGKCYFELGDFDAALANFAKVINAKDNQYMDYAQLLSADVKLKTGRVNEAKNDYKQLIENNPTSRHAPKARKMLQKI